MSGADNLRVYYGLKPMSFAEEMELPETVRQTRANKVRIVDMCDCIKHSAEMIQTRARFIPEEDDANHADMVQKLYDLVVNAYMELFDAEMYGII